MMNVHSLAQHAYQDKIIFLHQHSLRLASGPIRHSAAASLAPSSSRHLLLPQKSWNRLVERLRRHFACILYHRGIMFWQAFAQSVFDGSDAHDNQYEAAPCVPALQETRRSIIRGKSVSPGLCLDRAAPFGETAARERCHCVGSSFIGVSGTRQHLHCPKVPISNYLRNTPASSNLVKFQ